MATIGNREDQHAPGAPRDRIGAVAVVERVDSSRHGVVRLPNGKRVTGFVGERDAADGIELHPGLEVRVEMNPYDMSRARIIGLTAERAGD